MILVASCPIVAMADNDYSSSSTIKTETSKETSRMTSSDWAELQSQVEAEISSQNAEQSDKKSSNENSKGGSFKDFKDGKYVGKRRMAFGYRYNFNSTRCCRDRLCCDYDAQKKKDFSESE